MQLRLFIKSVLSSASMENGLQYYKVSFHDAWVSEELLLTTNQQLINDFKIKLKDYVDNREANDSIELAECSEKKSASSQPNELSADLKNYLSTDYEKDGKTSFDVEVSHITSDVTVAEIEKEVTTPEAEETNDKYSCQVCGKVFSSRENFTRHVLLHNNSNRYHSYRQKRPINESQNKDGGGFNKNIGSNNFLSFKNSTKKRRFTCQELEFAPEVLKNAKEYIKSVSLLRKRKSNLRTRLAKPGNNSLFGNIGVDLELNQTEESLPVISADSSGRTTYTCKVCERKFFNKFHHREHYNTHSGETPYECEFCRKKFAQRSGWNRHIKLHHKYEVFSGPIDRDVIMNHRYGSNSAEKPPPNQYLTYSHDVLPLPSMVQNHGALNTLSPILVQPSSNPQSNSHNVSPSSDRRSVGDLIASKDDLPQLNTQPTPVNYTIQKPNLPSIEPLTALEKVHNYLSSHVRESLSSSFRPADEELNPASSALTERAVQFNQEINTPIDHIISPDKSSNVTRVNLNFSQNSFSTIESPLMMKTLTVVSPTNQREFMFQCKKVQTMQGDIIFMVRLSGNTEYAYILDNHGTVKSRIYVNESPGSAEWLDFPLDETTDGVLLKRIQAYDHVNKRGQKPGPTSFKFASNFDIYNVDSEEKESDSDINQNILVETTEKQETTLGRKFRSGRLKKFSCPICSRKFLAQAHVNTHMLIHTGEFPYKCMFCARPFRHKSGLNSHHKRHFQRGIFNQPICGNKMYKAHGSNEEPSGPQIDEYVEKARNATEMPLNINTQGEKTVKRKGRPPKHLKKNNDRTDDSKECDTISISNIKSENIEVETGIAPSTPSLDTCNSPNGSSCFESFETLAVFECHFCSMKFTKKEPYLKHLEHHAESDSKKLLNMNNNSQQFANMNSDVIEFDDFDKTLVENPSALMNVKIKEEMIDE